MANVIGRKGQLVIEKEIRDRLGVGPGWKATQRIVDDHVELRFLPPTHNRSLAGCLKHLIDPDKLEPTDEEIDRAIEAGFIEEAREEEAQIRADWSARHAPDQPR
jgi:bifunctional DNA-binding transcriptional regulator/antitoxin component of YhaV-PrlF toxin-antitoxin module